MILTYILNNIRVYTLLFVHFKDKLFLNKQSGGFSFVQSRKAKWLFHGAIFIILNRRVRRTCTSE